MRKNEHTGITLGELLSDPLLEGTREYLEARASRSNQHDSVGAVIRFQDGIDLWEANRILTELLRRKIIHYTEAQSYDSSMGGPVWYIP